MRPTSHRCDAITEGGNPCRATPLRDAPYCFRHSPDHREAAQEASRLGGQRRRREGTVEGAYELDGLEGVALAQRIFQIAVVDTLSLENSNQRSRTLVQIASGVLRAHESGEFQAQIDELRAVLGMRKEARR